MATPYFAPEFSVQIEGEPIPPALRASITGVQHQSGIEGSDRVELNIANEHLRWSEHKLLRLDNKLALHVGYAPDQLTRVFVGRIVSQSASFPSSGLPTLTIAAQDRRHQQQEGQQLRSFGLNIPTFGTVPRAPDQVVAFEVSTQDGLNPTFDLVGTVISHLLGGIEAIATAGDPIELQKLVRKQEGESNYNFLTRLARENGWEMFIDHAAEPEGLNLHFFSTLSRPAADVTLAYGQSLMDFHPRISKVGQIASVTAYVWIARIKTQLAITVGWDWEKGLTLNIGGGINANKKSASNVLIEEPVAAASAPRKIIKHLIPKLNKYLTGSGSTVGNPRIQAGKILRLENLGAQFSGIYRVTSATHTIDSGGYRTSFEVRKELLFGLSSPAEQRATPVEITGAFSGVA